MRTVKAMAKQPGLQNRRDRYDETWEINFLLIRLDELARLAED
jgi:hypothetical protein